MSTPKYDDLKGKSVVVTGGGSNIGKGIVLAFARCGSWITIADIDAQQGEKVADEARKLNDQCRVLVCACDVTDPRSVQQMVSTVLLTFQRIDVLVNNVGWTVDRYFLEKSREEWEREVKLNLWSSINCIRAVVPQMIKQNGGAVVTIGSEAGRIGEWKEAVYSACKAGIIALSKSLAREVGKNNIRFNVVCPALTVPENDSSIGTQSMWQEMKHIFTPEVMERAKNAYPLKRLGRPSDIANAVLFFASDASSFVTGQTLGVSGGYCML